MKLRTPTLKEFTETVRAVLLTDTPKRAKYENRKPTQKELGKRWRLIRE